MFFISLVCDNNKIATATITAISLVTTTITTNDSYIISPAQRKSKKERKKN